jgi:hypothetical protein
MVPDSAGADLGAAHLRALQRALDRRGMTCDLDTRAVWPRLRVHSPYEASQPSVADFENSVVAAEFEDGWWFAWLWAEKISQVARVQSAADEITLELGTPDCQARVRTGSASAVPLLTKPGKRTGLSAEQLPPSGYVDQCSR